MRKGNLLFSFVQFIFVIALFLLGGLFIGLHYTPRLRMEFAVFITDHSVSLSLLGWAIIGCALLLCIGFYVMYRGAYYQVEMAQGQAVIDARIIEQVVRGYWKGRFPGQELTAEVVLRGKNAIEVLAEVPEMPLDPQVALLAEVELELGLLLERHLGHRREWAMTVIPRRP